MKSIHTKTNLLTNKLQNSVGIYLLFCFFTYSPSWGQQAAVSSKPVYSAQYQQLQEILTQYDVMSCERYWTFFSPDSCLRKGDSSDLVFGLRSNLIMVGDLDVKYATWDNQFDSVLVMAVQKFQRRHGLPEDGVLGPTTIHVMNVPLSKRMEQITVNMQRLKAYRFPVDQAYIRVNIPGYSLAVMENDVPLVTMKVIVGKKVTPTRLIESQISTVILNPSWHVPQSIVMQETLAAQKKDAQYLAKNHMKLYAKKGSERVLVNPDTVNWKDKAVAKVNWAVEQEPGSWNALGKIKFIFPNSYDIYLHDTPHKALFSHPGRAYSHGCVRVEKPVEMATFLLSRETSWNKQKIKDYLEKNTQTKAITLTQKVPVFITYFTAWIDEEGYMCFRDDIYDWDNKISFSSLPESQSQWTVTSK